MQLIRIHSVYKVPQCYLCKIHKQHLILLTINHKSALYKKRSSQKEKEVPFLHFPLIFCCSLAVFAHHHTFLLTFRDGLLIRLPLEMVFLLLRRSYALFLLRGLIYFPDFIGTYTPQEKLRREHMANS